MCGRFGLTNPQRLAESALLAELAIETVAADLPDPYPPRYNVAPSQPVLAVFEQREAGTSRESRSRTLAALQWGLVPRWAKDAKVGHRLVNARAETVATAPAYRDAFARGRRCAVLADVFYEWQDVSDVMADPRNGDPGTTGRRPVARRAKPRKQPWAIRVAGGEPFAFAGLWETWRDPADPTAAPLATCTLITTTPNALVSRLHDRMPVLLPLAAVGAWLASETSPSRARELLVPHDPAVMEAWPISTQVNPPENDVESVLEPIGMVLTAR